MTTTSQLELFQTDSTESSDALASATSDPIEAFCFGGTPRNFRDSWVGSPVDMGFLLLTERFRYEKIVDIGDMRKKLEVIQKYYPTPKPAVTKLDQESLDRISGRPTCIVEDSLNPEQSKVLLSILQDCLRTDVQMIPVNARHVNKAGVEELHPRFAITGVNAKQANAVIKMCYVNMVGAASARGETLLDTLNPDAAPIEKLTQALVKARMEGKDIGLVVPQRVPERRMPPTHVFAKVREAFPGRRF